MIVGWIMALGFALAAGLPAVVKKAESSASPATAAALLDESLPGASQDDQGWILLYAAEYRRLAGEAGPAREGFQKIAADFGGHPAREPAKVGLAVIDAKDRAGGNTLATLELIAETGVPGTLNADRWLLVARARFDSGEQGKGRDALRRAEASARGGFSQKRIATAATELRSKAAAPTPAAPPDSRPADLIAIDSIRAELAANKFAEARTKAEGFATAYPDSPFVTEAAYAKRRAEKQVGTDRGLLAVVLPLTGEYALPGGQLRDAIKLAAETRGGYRVKTFDTGGTADGCTKAVEQAVLLEGAAAILGPLTKDESVGCAATAQALHTPMITFTTADDPLAGGDQIFRAFPSVAEQVTVLLDDLMGRRGWTTFAIANPRTAFGETASRSFQSQVEARGGKVTATAPYDASATDFRSVGKVLGQKDYKARASEFSSTKAAISRAGGDPSKATLRPLIDYSAIFVPDGYQRAALLASALAFEEFPVGTFRPRQDDVPVGLVGLNAWNNPEWPRRGGDYVRDSIFVDAFWASDQAAATRAFVSRWRDRGKGDPTVVEAIGWDAVSVVAAAIEAEGGDIAANLLTVDVAENVSGLRGFLPERTPRRDWIVLTVAAAGIAPLYAAPPAAGNGE